MENRSGRKVAKKKFVSLFREYCSCSTIHGVQYVGDADRPIIEKVYWILIFILCSCLNFYLIWQLWYKWRESPVIVSFSETTTPVWQVPFPAITICSQTNFKSHLFSFERAMTNQENQDNLKKLAAMSLVCDPQIIFNGSETLNESDTDFLLRVAPSQEDTLQGCKMASKYIDCSEIFQPVFTEDGLCFTSNVLNGSEMFRSPWIVDPYPKDFPRSEYWTLEKGYASGSPIETYPRRALNSGDKSGFLLILAGNKTNHDTTCRGAIRGYKIILHNPAEIPSSSAKYVRIPEDQEILVWAEPNIMTTSDGLRGYAPSRRQCFYPDERQLKFFNVYTERNCELECLANHTLNECGCVSIYMPRDSATPVCGGGRKECYIEAQQSLRRQEVDRSFRGEEADACNCLPACTSISYQAETSQANFDWKTALAAVGEDVSDYEEQTMSRVSIFFAKTHFTTSHRSELFGIVDFLANCGGLLGLFSGISFLSLLEIIYFSTLRPWSNVRKEAKKRDENST